MARIVLADDNLPLLHAVGRVLRRAGHEVVGVPDGDTAIERIRGMRPDAVVLDVQMPGRTGLAVAAEMRADPDTAHIPVVIYSGSMEPGEARTAIDHVDDYVDKGQPVTELVRRIEAVITRDRP